MHAGLGDFPALVVLSRGDSVHVSLPDWADQRLADAIAGTSIEKLRQASYRKEHLRIHRPKVIAHECHAFGDVPVEESGSVERIHPSDIAGWADVIPHKRWEASGFDGDVPVMFGLRHHDEIAAVSGLLPFRGVPSDVVTLVHPKYRGKAYRVRVTKAAAAYAVGHHGLARMRFDVEDQRMHRVATSLGFTPYFEQLVVRQRD
jgi:GNAT superfamily N-acetyltransferase